MVAARRQERAFSCVLRRAAGRQGGKQAAHEWQLRMAAPAAGIFILIFHPYKLSAAYVFLEYTHIHTYTYTDTPKHVYVFCTHVCAGALLSFSEEIISSTITIVSSAWAGLFIERTRSRESKQENRNKLMAVYGYVGENKCLKKWAIFVLPYYALSKQHSIDRQWLPLHFFWIKISNIILKIGSQCST